MSLWWCDTCKSLVYNPTPGICSSCGGGTTFATLDTSEAKDVTYLMDVRSSILDKHPIIVKVRPRSSNA